MRDPANVSLLIAKDGLSERGESKNLRLFFAFHFTDLHQ